MTPTPRITPWTGVLKLSILGLLSIGFWYNLYAIGDLRNHTALFVTVFCALFILYLIAIVRPYISKGALILGIVLAVIFRLVVFFTMPTQSNDVYRYYWDAHVMHQGYNPYVHAPQDDELKPLRENPYFTKVGFQHLHTIYPPVAQGVFYTGYALSPQSLWGIKSLILLFDLGIIAVLCWILWMLKKPLGLVLLYAWHPLPIFEYASSGHNDAIMVFFLMLACAFFVYKKHVLSWGVLALSVLSKLSPMFLIPWFFKHLKWWTIAIFPMVFVLGLLPFIGAGDYLLDGLRQYGGDHEFNSSIYYIFANIFPESTVTVRFVLSILYIVFVTLVFFLYRKTTFERFFKGILWMLGGYLLIASNAHPWYLLWIIPFLTITFSPSWFFFSGAVIFSYFHYNGYIHMPNHLALAVQYIPLYAMLFFELGYSFAMKKEAIQHALKKRKRLSKSFRFQLFPTKDSDVIS